VVHTSPEATASKSPDSSMHQSLPVEVSPSLPGSRTGFCSPDGGSTLPTWRVPKPALQMDKYNIFIILGI
jgi:hypothetical protein